MCLGERIKPTQPHVSSLTTYMSDILSRPATCMLRICQTYYTATCYVLCSHVCVNLKCWVVGPLLGVGGSSNSKGLLKGTSLFYPASPMIISICRLISSPETGTLILGRWPPRPHYGSPPSFCPSSSSSSSS